MQASRRYSTVPDLETVDLVGVEILSVGGPVFGQGSPPEGDFWSADDLRAMAAADSELGDEINPPGKIGHSDAQRLLGLTDGEMPAVGWVENVRTSDDGTKLLADFLKVPKKFAELVETGAYRTRSVELSRVTSQATGKVYDWVVTGVAWLGGKLPAVKTLDDVVALYEARDLQLEARRYVVYAAAATLPDGVTTCSMNGVSGYSGGSACHIHDGTDSGKAGALAKAKADVASRKNAQPPDGILVWDPDAGVQDLMDDLENALNGPGLYGSPSRYWVCDLIVDSGLGSGKALVRDSATGDYDDAWVIPFTIDDLEPVVAPSSDWVKADQAWLATSEVSYAEGIRRFSGRSRGRADTRPDMPNAYSDDQRRTFAEATGLEEDAVTDEMLEAAGVAEQKPAGPAPEPRQNTADDDRVRRLEEDLAEQKRTLAEERETARVDRRRSFVAELMKDGKIEPGKREKWERAFDKDETIARDLAADLDPNEELGREFGSDEDGDPEERRELEEREYTDEAATRLGLPKEAIL